MTERYRKRLYNRDDDDYKTRYYRAHWQPACAIIGLVGCLLAMVFSGWPAIYLLREGGSVKPEGGLKSAKNLGADIAGAYIGVSAYMPVLSRPSLTY